MKFKDMEKMRDGLSKLIEMNPSMASEKEFYELLLGLAGKQADKKQVVLVVIFAFGAITGESLLSFSEILEAILDDADLIKAAKESLEKISLVQCVKCVSSTMH